MEGQSQREEMDDGGETGGTVIAIQNRREDTMEDI
jgi:hypothetical protein